MLKLGDKIINQIYLGDKKIAKAFLGEKLVFEADKPIFLEYIEIGVIGQYIDTEIVLNYNHKVTAVVKPVDDGRNLNHIIFGNLVDINKGFSCSCANKVMNSRFDGTLYADNLYRGGDTPHTYTVDKNGIVIDDEPIKTWQETPSEFTTIGTCILSGNRSTNGQPANYMGVGSRIYDFKIWENDILVQHLRPCVHPNGTVCMYDMVTKKYFYNQGTGEFIPAPRFVEYIQSTGTQYIDTGVSPSYDYTIKIKYSYTAFVSSYNCIFGARSKPQSEGNQIYWVGCNKFDGVLMTRMGKITSIYTTKLNEIYELIITPDEATINGTSIGDAMYDGEIGFSKSIILFTINDASPNLFVSLAKIYYFQIYDKDMNLIQDLRPCIDAKGVACMYDMVTNKYFYNQGTGEFISGDIL